MDGARWIGRPSRAVALVAAGVLAGAGGAGAAIAVGSSSSSDQTIYACVTTSENGLPVATANLQIIEPSAGQSCNSNPTGAAVSQKEISWNAVGNVVTLAGETFTISGVKQQATLENVSPVPAVSPNLSGKAVATIKLGSGKSALTFPIYGYSFDVSGSASSASSGSGAGKASVRDLQFTKQVDKASPTLFKACATGKHFPTATITVRRAVAGKQLTIKLGNVSVFGYSEASSKGNSKPAEGVSLSFNKIQLTYTPQR